MRLPRPRFTVRRLMVAVAITAVATYMGMVAWRIETYAMRADAHARHLNSGHSFIYDSTDLIQWHERMRLKYENAARNPWFPVAPDPPEPK
jgi:hypothetical protein